MGRGGGEPPSPEPPLYIAAVARDAAVHDTANKITLGILDYSQANRTLLRCGVRELASKLQMSHPLPAASSHAYPRQSLTVARVLDPRCSTAVTIFDYCCR